MRYISYKLYQIIYEYCVICNEFFGYYKYFDWFCENYIEQGFFGVIFIDGIMVQKINK